MQESVENHVPPPNKYKIPHFSVTHRRDRLTKLRDMTAKEKEQAKNAVARTNAPSPVSYKTETCINYLSTRQSRGNKYIFNKQAKKTFVQEHFEK
jgi:hypothetical protein